MVQSQPPFQNMRIGELAELSGLSIDTIRFYEKQGLIPAPRRTESNYRVYGPDTLRRLVFIRKARDLGFTLSEVAQLLALSEDHSAGAGDVRERARDKLRDLDRRLTEMQAMRHSLSKLVEACSGEGPGQTCPILAALTESDQTVH